LRPIPVGGLLPGSGTQGAVVAQQVVTNDGVVSTNYITNNYAVVVQGQLKQFTARAVDELNSNLTGGAGSNLNNLVHGWAEDYATNNYSNPTNAYAPYNPRDFTVMTAGQLKYVGNMVWTRLVAGGYTNALPAWLDTNSTDTQLANLGQLKQVFNFDLSTMVPATITSLTASDSNPGEIDLSWTLPAVNDGTSIIIQQSTDGGTTWATVATLTDPDLTSYAVTGLSGSSSYTFQVALQNNAGTSTYTSSGTALSPVPAAPASPTALTGSFDASGNMNLTWTASTGATSYLVERETLSTGTWSSLGTPTGAAYQDPGYGAGGYHYRVSAINSIGTSAPSTEFPHSRYAVIDLGANNIPSSLNNHGDVVGNNTNSNQPFIWHGGALTNLSTTPASPLNFPVSYLLTDTITSLQVSIETNYVYTQTFTPSSTVVNDINDSGAIVGTQYQEFSDQNDPNLVANENSFEAYANEIGGGISGTVSGQEPPFDLTMATYWSSGSAPPTFLFDTFTSQLQTGEVALDGPLVSWVSDPTDISNVNSMEGGFGGFSFGGNWWSSPSDIANDYPTVSGSSYTDVECMNRNGDVILDWQFPASVSPTRQGLLLQGQATPTLLPDNSGYFFQPVVAFNDAAPYIYIYGQSANPAWYLDSGLIYDSSNGQTVEIGSGPYSISTPTDPTKVQVISQGNISFLGTTSSVAQLMEKSVPSGGGTPAWNTYELNLSDLLPPSTGWQMNSAAKINNGGAIVGTATYSGSNTNIAAGSHGVLLIPLDLVVQTGTATGQYEHIDSAPLFPADSGVGIGPPADDTNPKGISITLAADLTTSAVGSMTATIGGPNGNFSGTLTETAANSGVFVDSGNTVTVTLPVGTATSPTQMDVLNATITSSSLGYNNATFSLVESDVDSLYFSSPVAYAEIVFGAAYNSSVINSARVTINLENCYADGTESSSGTLSYNMSETSAGSKVFVDSASGLTVTLTNFSGTTSGSVNSMVATFSSGILGSASLASTLMNTTTNSLDFTSFATTGDSVSSSQGSDATPDNPATTGDGVFYVRMKGMSGPITLTLQTDVGASQQVTLNSDPNNPGTIISGPLLIVPQNTDANTSTYSGIQVFSTAGNSPTLQSNAGTPGLKISGSGNLNLTEENAPILGGMFLGRSVDAATKKAILASLAGTSYVNNYNTELSSIFNTVSLPFRLHGKYLLDFIVGHDFFLNSVLPNYHILYLTSHGASTPPGVFYPGKPPLIPYQGISLGDGTYVYAPDVANSLRQYANAGKNVYSLVYLDECSSCDVGAASVNAAGIMPSGVTPPSEPGLVGGNYTDQSVALYQAFNCKTYVGWNQTVGALKGVLAGPMFFTKLTSSSPTIPRPTVADAIGAVNDPNSGVNTLLPSGYQIDGHPDTAQLSFQGDNTLTAKQIANNPTANFSGTN
jgi:hypothetical protein